MAQRLSVDKVLPADVRRRAVAELQAKRADAPAVGTWTNVGPDNVGGRLSSLAIGRDLGNNEIFWAGTADGGVFSSADGGATWTPRFDGQTALAIGAITVHPTIKQTVYVGTGEDDATSASYDGEGVFKSTDAGATWTSLGLTDTRRISRIVIDPTDTQRIFVAADGGIYVQDANRGLYLTTNGGTSWTKVLYGDIDAGVYDVAMDPTNHLKLFASIWQRSRANNNTYWGGTKSGLYRSTDGGTTWTKLAGGFPQGSIGKIGVAIAPSQPSTVYASVRETSGSFKGVYKSLDGGTTWTKVDASSLNLQLASYGWWFGPIRVDPTNPNTVYLLDVSLWRSTNGGKNWSQIAGELHADQHELLIESTGRMLEANDGGFNKSTNNGTSFQRFTAFPISQFYDICTNQVRPQHRMGGLQDNGSVRTQTGGRSDWANVIGGDGMECEIDWADGQHVYGESQNGGINRSIDGGNTFFGATNGIDGSERRNWVTPLRIDPVTHSTVYTGAQRVYRSTDYANFWSAISPDLTASTLPNGNPISGTITALGVSKVDPNTIWAGTDNGNVWVTSTAGAIWTKVNPTADTYWITEIIADPFDVQTAYVTISGYKLGSKLPYIRVTHDRGATWQDLSAGLPAMPLNSVIADPLYTGRLFVSSDIGVHVSADAGATWSTLGSGMPSMVVLDLALNETTWTLYAGTHARSIYGYDIRQLPQQDWDGDGDGNLDDCARSDAATHHGAAEVNDGADNQCAGDADFGIVDEISGDAGFHDLGDKTAYAWPGQIGATGYEVARSADPTFTSGCARFATAAPSISDAAVPATASAFYYLVRATAPNVGSWGRQSSGAERAVTCP